PLFCDKMVRRALTMLMPREAIRDQIYHGLAMIMTGNFMPGTPEYKKSIEPWPFDPEQASQILDEAGWVDSDGDGLRDKDGMPFRFEITITNSNDLAERICTVYQEELRRVGIEMNIRTLEWASLLERIDSRQFDAMLMGWSMPPDPDPYQVWHSSQIDAGSNYVGFNNPECDQIIEEARVTFDAEKRAALYNRFHEILHDEQPYTFLLAPKELLAVDKRVHGVNIYTYGPESLEWFVPAEYVRFK
ncbi:MAG: peptide-binding protein, partial [Candidatus Hydrogenedentes bacterium]|nr:peptide-binding protein [Candidatus Hydrogenedentota bacterium]